MGIFGGSKSKSQTQSQSTSQSQNASWNDAYPFISQSFSPMVSTGTSANSFIGQLLGLEGGDAANQAFGQYRDSAGYDFIRNEALSAIDGNMAGRRVFNSGATAKALNDRAGNIASTFYNNYLDRLLGLSNQGLGAGQLITSAGQKSTGSSSSQSTSSGTSSSKTNPDLSNLLGSAISAIAVSDRRLKQDIEHLYTLDNGLKVYEFSYIWDPDERVVGVMADEVAVIKPEALGPEIKGYQTVDYGKL